MARQPAPSEDASQQPSRAAAAVGPPPSRGLKREQAAAYIGVSARLFDRMVADGTMPKPRRYGGRTIWDRHQLDLSFDALPGDDSDSTNNSWDRVL